MRDDIKSNIRIKQLRHGVKLVKGKTIGNEIKGNAKESGPRFSKHLNKDGIADALGVLCYMIANADNSDVKSLVREKNRMVVRLKHGKNVNKRK